MQLQLCLVPHEGLRPGLCFDGGWGIQSTVEQNCICGDQTIHLYTYCADHTFQVAHLHVHYEQCVKLAVTTAEHALLCVAHWSSLLYHTHMPVLPCTH